MEKQEFMKFLYDIAAMAVKEIARKGVLFLVLMLVSVGLSITLYSFYHQTRQDIHDLRLEYKQEIAEARNETRQCEQARIEQAAIFTEQITGLKQELATTKGQLSYLLRRVK